MRDKIIKILNEYDRESLLILARDLKVPKRRKLKKDQLLDEILKFDDATLKKSLDIKEDKVFKINSIAWLIPIIGILIGAYFYFNPLYKPQIPEELEIFFEAIVHFELDVETEKYIEQLKNYAKEPSFTEEPSMLVLSKSFGEGFAIPKSLLNKNEKFGHSLNRLFNINFSFIKDDEQVLYVSGSYNDKWTIERLSIDGKNEGIDLDDNSISLCYFPVKNKIILHGSLKGKLNKNTSYNDLIDLANLKLKGRIGALRMTSNYKLLLNKLRISTKDGLTLEMSNFENKMNAFELDTIKAKWE